MKLFIVMLVMLAAILGFWWWTWTDLRNTSVELAQCRSEVAGLRGQVEKTEKFLLDVEGLRREVEVARQENAAKFLEAMGLYGNERLDYLERMLREDAERRCPVSSSPAYGVAGAVH